MKVLPSLYWRLHKSLEKHGLDDGSIAREFRLSKKDVREAKREMEEANKIETRQEFWFGKNPFKNNGEKEKKKEGVK